MHKQCRLLGVHRDAVSSRMLNGRRDYERVAFDAIAEGAFSSGPACALTEVRGDGERQEDRQKRDSRHDEATRAGSLRCFCLERRPLPAGPCPIYVAVSLQPATQMAEGAACSASKFKCGQRTCRITFCMPAEMCDSQVCITRGATIGASDICAQRVSAGKCQAD